MRMLSVFSTAATAVWIIFCVSSVFHAQVGASYGEHCSQNDTTNCTPPQLFCLPSRTCGCSQGFVADATGPNGTFCRLPVYNETCDIMIGCQPEAICSNTSRSWKCQCDSAVDYYNSSLGQCVNKPIFGQSCDVNIGCEVQNECSGTPPTCQCNTSTVFFDSMEYQCLPMSDLKVNILSTIITPSTVTFTWEEQNPDTGVFYWMIWAPYEGQLDYIKADGGQVSGLNSETVYHFTITTVLPENYYYPEKTVSEPIPPFQTMGVHVSSENHTGLGVAITLGSIALTVLVVVAGTVLYKRRRSSRLQEDVVRLSTCKATPDCSQLEEDGPHHRESSPLTIQIVGRGKSSVKSYGTLSFEGTGTHDIEAFTDDGL